MMSLEASHGTLNPAIIAKLNRRYLMVMEFLKGSVLEHMKPFDMKNLFGEKTLTSKGKDILRQIGLVAGFDLLLNNTDRLPLLAV